MRVPLFELRHHSGEALLQVSIHEDAVKVAGRLSVFEFGRRVGQTRLDGLLAFGGSSPQALLQFGLGGWRDEDVEGIESALLDFLHALHVNVENTDLALFLHIFDGSDTA